VSTQRLQSLLHSLRQAAGRGAGDAPGDGELLHRWLSGREELAFEVLVWRHGPLVLGVCRRVLTRDSDVEDAFQATFLALVRKAGSVRDGGSLAAWLHRVAWRVALRARRTACRREELPLTGEEPGRDAPGGELGELLDAEIDRLPERYRRAVVLCLLEGHSQPEAARLLGVPVGTLSSLLCRGRERLRRRLERYGLSPQPAPVAAVPAGLVAPAVRIALSSTCDGAAGAVPARVAELASGVIAEMSRQKLLTGWAIVLAVAVLLGGGSVPLFNFIAPRGVAADVAKEVEPEPDPTLVEPFDGKLRLKWKVLRPDEKRYSLTKNKGKLTITTQRGTIHAEADRTEIKAKNLFLLNNPSPKKDFEVTVCISGFTPKEIYQQGGLICYDDDDNYVKFVYEFSSFTNAACLGVVSETAAKSNIEHFDAPKDSKKVWLRLTRRGEKYECASSGDGKKWTVHVQRAWGEKGPAKIGLIAKNGGTNAPEVDVCFEDFRLRPAPAPAKEKEKE
jgi:RNA polymerase sigma factor (sigma-70 family)